MTNSRYTTIREFERFVDESIENLLPGYIKRHQREIVLAVQQRAKYRFGPEAQDNALWGAMAALDALAGRRPKVLDGEEEP